MEHYKANIRKQFLPSVITNFFNIYNLLTLLPVVFAVQLPNFC